MTNIFIFGSCVARDTAATFDESFTISRYVARQSMLSAVHGPAQLEGEVELDSPFQTRCVEADVAGDALEALRASGADADLMLLDLMDERLGVYEIDGTAFVTKTWELEKSGILQEQPHTVTHLQFGSDEHFALWKEAAARVAADLKSLGKPALVLAPPLADRDLDGEGLEYLNQPIDSWNSSFDRYYDALAELGITVLRPPAELGVADKQHQWGLAPFHYAAPMYAWFKSEIMRTVGQLSASQP
ncbi:DUF6270 domain-containing protein [Agrococcus casei]|uniref:DUF6270 domain-containing protein n=1 Tax=Agrococcus casei TaxID=343512 RepID=UPI003F9BCEEB